MKFFLVTLVFLPVFAANSVKHDQELKQRDYMIEISRQLGVTCNYCHDVKNFRSETLKTWKKSKSHMQMVDLLNTRSFKGTDVKADCFMCHRGKAMPDYKESAASNEATKSH